MEISGRNFIIGNAQIGSRPAIFCNDGFCELTGFSRAEVMQKASHCTFLHGPLTSPDAASQVVAALEGSEERQIKILYYKKDGKSTSSMLFRLIWSS